MRQRFLCRLFGEIQLRLGAGKEVIYNLFPKFHMRHEEFSFNGPRKPDEGGDTDTLDNVCWPKLLTILR